MTNPVPHRLQYADGVRFIEDFEKNLKFGGCQIVGQAGPGLFEAVDVTVEVGGVEVATLRGRVVHEIGGEAGFMVQFDGGSLKVQEILAPVLERVRDTRSPSGPMPLPEESRSKAPAGISETDADWRQDSGSAPSPEAALRPAYRRQDSGSAPIPEAASRPAFRRQDSGSAPIPEAASRPPEPSPGTVPETEEDFTLDSLVKLPPEDLASASGPPSERIRALPVNEKKRLALSGDRAERMILARDPMVIIQPFLLKNPKISLDEVLFLARYGQANPEALEIISENKRWMSDSRVVLGLVLNPKAPMPLAVRLLDRLPVAELRRIAKRTDLKQPLLQAARKRVVQPS